MKTVESCIRNKAFLSPARFFYYSMLSSELSPAPEWDRISVMVPNAIVIIFTKAFAPLDMSISKENAYTACNAPNFDLLYAITNMREISNMLNVISSSGNEQKYINVFMSAVWQQILNVHSCIKGERN